MKKNKKWKKSEVIKKIIAGLFCSVPSDLVHLERQNAGFFFGTKSVLGNKYYIGKAHNCDGHIAVIGGSGSGKSSCVAIPTLSTWTRSIVATDIKGELSAHYSQLLKTGKVRRQFIKFAPMEASSATYDPYHLLRQCGEKYLVQYSREIALSIIPLPPDVREPFWVEAAQNLLTAAILYYFGIGANFSETMIGIQTTPTKNLIAEILGSQNQNASMFINQIRDLDKKVLAGVATELSNRTMVFATDPFISEAFDVKTDSELTFTWDDIEKHNIFLCIPEDKLEQWRGAITLMINQLFRVLERSPDMFSQQADTTNPILLLLDEFPMLGKLEILSAVSTLRSKNVTFAIFVQSLAQIDLTYGECARRIIADNCLYKIFLGANDPESQRYMSAVIGGHEVVKKTHSHGISTERQKEAKRGVNRGVSYSKQYEPVIRPEEFGRLKDGILVAPEGHYRIKKSPHYAKDKPKKKNPIVRAVEFVFRKATDLFKWVGKLF